MPIVYAALVPLPEELAADALILFAITELDAVVVLLPDLPIPDVYEVQS